MESTIKMEVPAGLEGIIKMEAPEGRGREINEPAPGRERKPGREWKSINRRHAREEP